MIQTIGRAARNENGRVIMYADRITGSMDRAITETERRREVQNAYNKKHNITPKSIHKEVKELIELTKLEEEEAGSKAGSAKRTGRGKNDGYDDGAAAVASAKKGALPKQALKRVIKAAPKRQARLKGYKLWLMAPLLMKRHRN